MKINITKEEYDALDESIQGLYTENADGGFKLDLEDLEDTGALKRAKEHEKEARKKAETKAREIESSMKELQTQMEELQNGESRKKGDVESLEKSYQKKMQELESKYKEQIDGLTSTLKKNTVDATARQLASDLSGENADIILPHIRNRLAFEYENGDAKVRVLDENGNVTADSIDDLKNSYFTNEKFSPIIVGSKASGGGASGAKGGGGATGQKKLSEMSATEEAQFANENPEAYQKMLATS